MDINEGGATSHDHHAHGGPGRKFLAPEPKRLRLIALATIIPIAIATLVAMIWLWPSGDFRGDNQMPVTELKGSVVDIKKTECPEDSFDNTENCGVVTVELSDGDRVETDLPGGLGAPKISVGDKVVVASMEVPEGEMFAIVDHQRSQGLWVLLIAFVIALIMFARWRGVTSLIGLAVTFGILLFFVVPAILGGASPVLIAIVASSAIMVTVLYLTHGFSLATTVAFVGTLASFILTGFLSWLSVKVLHLSGVTDDISMSLESTFAVDMRGLLLASIVIGTLGVLDDVTVTQAVTVRELAHANPDATVGELFRAGSRVGHSHIASVVNTIVLAYAGASLPVLILVVAGNDSFAAVVTTQFISQEIVRSVIGTIGLIAAVPITTGLAAILLRESDEFDEDFPDDEVVTDPSEPSVE